MSKNRTPPKGRQLLPNGGNDRVYTPDALAYDIVVHVGPSGRIMEPAAGGGAFLRAFDRLALAYDWCELDLGRDFFDCRPSSRYDFVITNPPYSLFTRFLRHSMTVANNVVFLCPIPAWFQRARERAIAEAGFGIVEIVRIPVQPPPFPQFGLSLGVAWLRRGWSGSPQFTRLRTPLWPPVGDKMLVAAA